MEQGNSLPIHIYGEPLNGSLSGNRVPLQVLLQFGHTGVGGDPKSPVTSVLIRRGHTYTQGRRSSESEGRHGGDAAAARKQDDC